MIVDAHLMVNMSVTQLDHLYSQFYDASRTSQACIQNPISGIFFPKYAKVTHFGAS